MDATTQYDVDINVVSFLERTNNVHLRSNFLTWLEQRRGRKDPYRRLAQWQEWLADFKADQHGGS